ncbi:hypothetical protein [Acinetobacter sp. HY1485]|uniref:hypothetical protein n=1 Tax=Acinetobacter sp. HY1485 TaxID=2970918 RepID=UPI0022B9618E|nr:hypothetical protein [Acinetobacter sp. HY1485]
MKKLILFSVCLLGYTSILAASPNQENDINIMIRPAIYGLWGMKIPENQCIEYYNFKNNGQAIIHSAKEWSTGIYEYQPSDENNEIGALALQIKYDNNEKDCSNQQINQTGEVSQYFIHWKDDNNIQFCDSAKGTKCFADLKRVLP